MNHKIKKYGQPIALVLLILIVAASFFMSIILGGKGNFSSDTKEEIVTMYDEELLAFNDNWRIYVSGELLEESGNLPCQISCEKDEIISITSYLPRAMVEGTYLRIQSIKAYVEVYIDDELIYSGGKISLGVEGEKSMPVDRWNFVQLKPEYSELEITITYQSPYAFFSGILPEITLGSYSESLFYTYSFGNVYVYLGICIIAVGVIMLLIALINTIGNNVLRPYVYLGMFTILMGLMFITQANVPRISAAEYYQDFVLENVTFRLGVVLLAVYVGSKFNEKQKKIVTAAIVIACVFLASSIFLHFTGKADFNETLVCPAVAFTILLLICLWKEIEPAGGGSRHYRITSGLGTGVLAATFWAGLIQKAHFFVVGLDNVFLISFLTYSVVMCIALIMNSYDLAMEQIRTAEELNRTKIRLMVSQIQPHFIHNTLNTMRAMVLIEPKRAADLILHFSNYLRYNLDSLDAKDIVVFAEELRHIKEYTAIQCERFHRITVKYEIDATDFVVPPLSVQVFVENAIKHGICRKEGGGTVTVKSSEKKEAFVVEIIDDGVGFDPSILTEGNSELGIGIKNAIYRLKELANAEVDIKSRPLQGCQVKITFPGRKEGE